MKEIMNLGELNCSNGYGESEVDGDSEGNLTGLSG